MTRTGSVTATVTLNPLDLLLEKSDFLSQPPDPGFVAAQFVAELNGDQDQEDDRDEEQQVRRGLHTEQVTDPPECTGNDREEERESGEAKPEHRELLAKHTAPEQPEYEDKRDDRRHSSENVGRHAWSPFGTCPRLTLVAMIANVARPR